MCSGCVNVDKCAFACALRVSGVCCVCTAELEHVIHKRRQSKERREHRVHVARVANVLEAALPAARRHSVREARGRVAVAAPSRQAHVIRPVVGGGVSGGVGVAPSHCALLLVRRWAAAARTVLVVAEARTAHARPAEGGEADERAIPKRARRRRGHGRRRWLGVGQRRGRPRGARRVRGQRRRHELLIRLVAARLVTARGRGILRR